MAGKQNINVIYELIPKILFTVQFHKVPQF